ncbi:MAG: hypothetical protein ACRELF_09520 [Gemmataceae bacterium]
MKRPLFTLKPTAKREKRQVNYFFLASLSPYLYKDIIEREFQQEVETGAALDCSHGSDPTPFPLLDSLHLSDTEFVTVRPANRLKYIPTAY